jgi:hypothetical protein
MKKEYWYVLIAVAALILLLAYFRLGSKKETPGRPAGTVGRSVNP